MKKFIILLALVACAANLWSWNDPWYAPQTNIYGDWIWQPDVTYTYKGHFFFREKEADLLQTMKNETYEGFILRVQTENVVISDSVFFRCQDPADLRYYNIYKYTVVGLGANLCREVAWMKTVKLPTTLRRMQRDVFVDCTGLTSAVFPASCVLDTLPYGTFSGCTSLTSVTLPVNLKHIGGYSLARTAFTSFTIPATVRSIGYGAFAGCPNLTSLAIPANIEYVEGKITYGCNNLTAIHVASENPNYSSIDGVLFNKDQTQLHEYPYGKKGAYTMPNTVTEIYEENFSEYPNLTAITIGDGVLRIGKNAFSQCRNLTKVTFGSSVEVIGQYAFKGCSALDTVIFSPGIDVIGNGAFTECEALSTLTFPENLTTIKMMAFSACTGLTSITLGRKVTKIESGAFLGCSNLSSITCYATTPPDAKDAFISLFDMGVDKSTCVVYVPMSALPAYQNATEWQDFEHIVGFREPPTEVISTEPKAIAGLSFSGASQTLISAGAVRGGASAVFQYRIGTEGEWSTELPQAVNAGAYNVYYYLDYGHEGDDAEENIFGPVACTIAKAKPLLTAAPAALAGLNNTGETQTLIYAGTVTNGTLYYSLDHQNWSTALPTAADSGYYHVYYRIEGEQPNYYDLNGFIPLVASIGINDAPAPTVHEEYDPEKIEPLDAQQGDNTKGFWIFKGESYKCLFDGDKTTKWCSWTADVPFYCQRPKDVVAWKTAEAVRMVSYTLTTGNDTQNHPERNWKSWTMYGGTFAGDDEAEAALLTEEGWTIIDNRINDDVLQAQDTTGFRFAVRHPGTYQYYRLVIHDINGEDNIQQMAELTMGVARPILPTYITRPSARAYLQHTGEDQPLIEPGNVTNGTILYSMDGSHWSTALPQAADAGNYYVYYKAQALDLSTETETDTLIATIYDNRAIPTYVPFGYSNISVLTYRQGERTAVDQNADKLFYDFIDIPKSEKKWCSVPNGAATYSDRPKDIVVWKTVEPVTMTAYRLRVCDDAQQYPNRNWYSWTIYGGTFADDAEAAAALLREEAWTIIDNQIKDTVLQEINDAMYEFACNTPDSYQYYRLVIHDLHVTDPAAPQGIQQMAELTMGVKPHSPATDIEETNVNRQSSTTAKFIRNGNLYIIRNDKVYTITGQRVN